MEKAFIAIDMKSFYASVECVFRGLDPLKANLLVADPTRSDQTICLAVSPSLKAKGVSSRPRLFEAKGQIKNWEARYHQQLCFLIATPRMAEYERVSARIYSIILRHVAPEDVHVYSIDESFIDCAPYLHLYRQRAAREGVEPSRLMAISIVRDILKDTGITATVGIGTNMYLAKVAMDIVAKKMPADQDGVRIAELNEDSYRYLLWDHRPLTDFWQIGSGKATSLEKACLFTMGDVARRSLYDEEWFYKKFGIDGEILIDHAWGVEPVAMRDIKTYYTDSHSLSKGQVLPRPYRFDEARLVLSEMIDVLCADLLRQHLLSASFTWYASYDWRSLEVCPGYDGPTCQDWYGRLHPRHNNGTARTRVPTNSLQTIREALLMSFDETANRHLLFRRFSVSANEVAADDTPVQIDMFTDDQALEKENRFHRAMLAVRSKFGLNALFTAKNLMEGATTLERNTQIGGHRA